MCLCPRQVFSVQKKSDKEVKQIASDLDFIKRIAPLSEEHVRHPFTHEKPTYASDRLFLIFAIHFYQRLISTQDMPSCNFIPSCSNFGLEAIQKFGVLKGTLLTADRLLRCHSLTYRYYPDYYKLDEELGRFVNPVDAVR
jgi:putative membrane protein insertion efficiency factor